MKTQPTNAQRAWSRMDTLGLLLILTCLSALFFSCTNRVRAHDERIQCVNNLKYVGLAFRVWQGDHNDKYPMSISTANGGTLELVESGTAFRHFQVLSNQLNSPKILCCPSDYKTKCATNFTAGFNNQQLSYFVGVDAVDTQPQMFLAGDRNITNGTPVKGGVLTLTTNEQAGWTDKIHDRQGCVAMADASVQQFSTSALRSAIQYTGVTTNRLAIP